MISSYDLDHGKGCHRFALCLNRQPCRTDNREFPKLDSFEAMVENIVDKLAGPGQKMFEQTAVMIIDEGGGLRGLGSFSPRFLGDGPPYPACGLALSRGGKSCTV